MPVETVRACETLYPQFCVETILDESWETAEAHLRERSPLEILCIYLLTIPELRRRYEKKGIPEDILWNGLRDISIWAAEYEQRYQRPGIAEWRWVAKTLRMEVFRLGRLQFEPTYLQQELRYDGETVPSGTSALNVHIPAGEPLTENAACDEQKRFSEIIWILMHRSCAVIHGFYPQRCRTCFHKNLIFCAFRKCSTFMRRERIDRQRKEYLVV